LLLVVALLALAACADDEYELEIEVRADAAAATGFGVEPGDPVPDADIEVTGPDDSNDVFDRVSDEAGEATIDLPGEGSYEVFITAPTTDPLCVWLGGATVAVEEGTTTLLVDDLMVACQ
jgi:hypothetical protein